jgi:hypothetical protein
MFAPYDLPSDSASSSYMQFSEKDTSFHSRRVGMEHGAYCGSYLRMGAIIIPLNLVLVSTYSLHDGSKYPGDGAASTRTRSRRLDLWCACVSHLFVIIR